MQTHFLSARDSTAFILFTVFLAFNPSSKVRAQGNILVAPNRAVFEGHERYKELTLSNTGQDTSRYDISFKHYGMTENGSLEELAAPSNGIAFADSFVRFFPRKVILAPGEAQVVRLQLSQTGKMIDGEYRSHLYFRAVPKPKPLGENETTKRDSNAISIKLNAVFGIAVPVIIHVGESTTKVSVTNSAFEMTKAPFVSMTLNRIGNMSCYGDISIDYIAPSGEVTRVAEQTGIAVYTPIEQRQVKLPVQTNSKIDYTKGKLHVVYKAKENLNQNSIGQAEIYLN
jgi:hypothetical protein